MPGVDPPKVPHELRTERLLLRQWTDADIDALTAIAAQPEYLEFMPPSDRERTAGFVERMRRGWRDEGVSQWAAVDLQTGAFIGRIGLLRHHDWPLEPDPIEVGWTLDRDYWGRGLATEGGRAALECWRKYLPDDRRVISITVAGNVRSRAVMERLGLTYRGKARWRDLEVVWYAMDR